MTAGKIGSPAASVEVQPSGRILFVLRSKIDDWAACQPALQRLGQVLVAGCRDAVSARQLGFVPAHGVGAALAMTQGWDDRPPRVGFLLSPPYFPLRVKS